MPAQERRRFARLCPGHDAEVYVTFSLTFVPVSVTDGESPSSRDVTGDGRLMERVRFLRAGLVTPLPGGPGIDPAGIMPGARGASLKRGSRRGCRVPASREARLGLRQGVQSPRQAPRWSAERRARPVSARRAAAPADAAPRHLRLSALRLPLSGRSFVTLKTCLGRGSRRENEFARHRERSEAIQRAAQSGLLRRFAPRNDERYGLLAMTRIFHFLQLPQRRIDMRRANGAKPAAHHIGNTNDYRT